MDIQDKGDHARATAKKSISRESMDEEGRRISQRSGKALNVSKAGLKLETHYPVEQFLVSLATMDLDDHLIEIIGEPLYCRQVAEGKFHSGIQFIGSDEEIREFALKLVKLHHQRKFETYIEVTG